MRICATSKWKKRLASGLAGTAVAIALPSSVLALNLLEESSDFVSSSGSMNFTPASIAPDLARILVERSSSDGQNMRFTPAGGSRSSERSVTVAVRVGQTSVQNLSIRSAIETASNTIITASAPGLQIAPTRYNLGLARGYQSFAKAPEIAIAPSAGLSSTLSDAAMPDLSEFTPTPGIPKKPSRFGAHIELEETEKVGAAPRTLQASGDQSLDLAGSYRLTRNLDVTAGVRYSQERDVLSALPDTEAQDSQAVYIGTQFRF